MNNGNEQDCSFAYFRSQRQRLTDHERLTAPAMIYTEFHLTLRTFRLFLGVTTSLRLLSTTDVSLVGTDPRIRTL